MKVCAAATAPFQLLPVCAAAGFKMRFLCAGFCVLLHALGSLHALILSYFDGFCVFVTQNFSKN